MPLRYNEPGSGPPVSTDLVAVTGNLEYIQRFKLGLGVLGQHVEDLSFGQAVMASSVPVVLASNHTSLPVTVGNFPAASTVVGVSGTPTVQLAAGQSVNIGNSPTVAVSNPVVVVGVSGVPTVAVSNFPANQATTQSGPWSVAISGQPVQIGDNGGSITVDGAVSVSNFPTATTVVGVSGIPTVQGTVVVQDGGGSLTVDGTVSISNFPAATTVVGVSGTPTVSQGGNWMVGISGTPAVQVSNTVTVQDGGGSLSVDDNGGSITVDGTVSVGNFPATQAVTQSGPWAVAISGQPVNIADNGGSLTVDGTVAVSNFPAATTVVGISGTPTVSQGTNPWVIGDGGGSVTVDGTVGVNNFPTPVTVVGVSGIPTVQGSVSVSNFPAATVVVGVSGIPTIQGSVNSTQAGNWMVGISGLPLSVTLTNPADSATIVGISGIPTVQGTVVVQDGGGSLTVDGTVAVSNFPTAPTVVGVSGTPTVQGTVGATQVGNWMVGLSGTPAVQVSNTVTVQDGGGSLSIDDNGGSLTVDGTVTVQDGGGAISVDDNGGSLTVDGTVAVSNFPAATTVVGVSGTPTIQGSVSVSNFPTPTTVVGISGIPTVNQGTSPWVIGDGGGSVTVDGTVSVAGTVTVDTELPAAVALGDTLANPTTPLVGAANLVWDSGVGGGWERAVTVRSLPDSGSGVGIPAVALVGYNGTTFDRLRSTTANGLAVDVTRIQGGVIAVTGVPHVIVDSVPTTTVQDGGGSLSVDDNGGSLTIDGSVSVSNFPTATTVVGISGIPTVSVSNFPTATTVVGISGIPTVNQGTSPWVVSVSNTPTVDTELPAAATLADAAANPATPTVGAANLTWNGATWDRWKGIVGISGIPTVSVSNTVTVADGGGAISVDDNGGSLTVDGTVAVSNLPTVVGISGIPTVSVSLSAVAVTGSLPTGTNSIGQVTANQGGSWSVTADTELPSAAALQDAAANPTTPMIGASVLAWNGVTWDRWKPVVGISGVPTVAVASDSLAALTNGSKSGVGTSGVVLMTSVTAYKGIEVKAANSNTGTVYVGSASGVTAGTSDANDGFELGAGESMFFPVNNINKLWVIGSTTGQKLFWAVF
ncbi:MAG: hypothetical protein K2R98_19480 [Gemmataceae bacterium]|nr:hypothetical protein [Gemmataceae bacterium]